MQKVIGVGRLLVEENTIELAPGNLSPMPLAIEVADTEADESSTKQTPDYRHGDIVIRENRIRYLDGALDAGWSGQAMKVAGAKNVIVAHNVIECAPANPLRSFRCGAVTYFNNKTPAGALIRGLDGVSQIKHSELETEAEDALLMTLI
jgi:hypothetical protein